MSKQRALIEWLNDIDCDAAFLADCLAEVLTDLGESDLADVLPWRSPQGGPRKSRPLDLARVNRELQAMSIAYHLLNMVEEYVAANARRDREIREGLLAEPGLWGHGLARLRADGFSEADVVSALDAVRVEVVLTAHPTEAKRPVVLRQHRALFDEYAKLKASNWTPQERAAIRGRIKVLLERLWRTGEMHLRKPDVLSELEYVLDYLTMVFPQAVVALHQRLKAAWAEAGFDPAAIDATALTPHLYFGNWVGGDRDGHPLVTAEVTRETLAALRRCAISMMRNHLTALMDRLTLSDLFADVPETLRHAITEKRRHLPPSRLERLGRFPHEPWREFIALVRALLDDAETDAESPYARPQALRDDLRLLADALRDAGATRIAEADVAPVLLHLDTFGFHTAALDIRQNSDFHAQAIADLLRAAGYQDWDYAQWDYAKRRQFLDNELISLRPIAPRGGRLGEHAEAALAPYQVVAEHIERFGPGGIGTFIVSMTRDVTDLLAVYLLAREAGLLRTAPGSMYCLLRIAPLFETLQDLKASPTILADFLDHPITRESKRHFGEAQEIMVGYSDSNKSGGMFASQWALNTAQRALSEVCQSRGLSSFFFHGRGGTFSRGAGPTNRFLEALPRGTLDGRVRLTEQGEVIAQKFGNLPTAIYNLELLAAGVMAATLEHSRDAGAPPDLRALGDTLDGHSQDAYRNLLEFPGFIKFWSAATPIDALEQSFIGSRPSRRSGKRSVEDLRAIPWVFSWAQARYYLPGWFGVGYALERLETENPAGFARLRESSGQWPFIRYVLYNAETSLASADLGIMERYAGLVDDKALRDSVFAHITREYQRTERMLDRFFGAPRAERRPRLMKTLRMRAEGLERLHQIQIALLREWRALRRDRQSAKAKKRLPWLLLSVNAIASAERTTG